MASYCPNAPLPADRCYKPRRPGGCRRPNAWVQFLVANGKQGRTRAWLVAHYPRGLTGRQKCNATRRNAQQRERVVGTAALNPYQTLMNWPNIGIHPTSLMRRLVSVLARDHFAGQRNWVAPAFVTQARVEVVYRAVDDMLFGGGMSASLVRRGRTLEFRVTPIKATNTGVCADAWNVGHVARDGLTATGPNTHRIVFYTHNWRGAGSVATPNWMHPGIHYPYVQGGRRTKSMLESMVFTMVHELAHIIMRCWAPGAPSHGPRWMRIYSQLVNIKGAFFDFHPVPGAFVVPPIVI
jgi:hypothetical protein